MIYKQVHLLSFSITSGDGYIDDYIDGYIDGYIDDYIDYVIHRKIFEIPM